MLSQAPVLSFSTGAPCGSPRCPRTRAILSLVAGESIRGPHLLRASAGWSYSVNGDASSIPLLPPLHPCWAPGCPGSLAMASPGTSRASVKTSMTLPTSIRSSRGSLWNSRPPTNSSS